MLATVELYSSTVNVPMIESEVLDILTATPSYVAAANTNDDELTLLVVTLVVAVSLSKAAADEHSAHVEALLKFPEAMLISVAIAYVDGVTTLVCTSMGL